MGSLNKSSGFSLIELMIAMVISLFILAGLFYSVIGDMRSYESTRSTQNMVTKSRMAIQTFRLYIQQAGFRDLTALKNETTFTSVSGDWESGQVVKAMTTSDTISDEKNDSDILVIRFLGASQPGIVSCNGDDVTNTATATEITLYVNTSNQLMCRTGTAAADILDNNVEYLKLLFGTEEDLRYFTASTVTDWTDINRIKVGLLVSEDVKAHGLTNSNNYTIFGNSVTTDNDTKYRSVVMETINIGNQGG